MGTRRLHLGEYSTQRTILDDIHTSMYAVVVTAIALTFAELRDNRPYESLLQ